MQRIRAVTGDDAEWFDLEPKIISAKWERNNHLLADSLTVTFPHRDAGVDPRLIKNAHILFYLWDANQENLDREKHLRFVGICTDATRVLDGGDAHVEMTFHDYTALFVETKHVPPDAIPEWHHTLEEAWECLCSGVGCVDNENGKIQSSVSALAKRLVVRLNRPHRTIGEMVPERLRALSKPHFSGSDDGWKVWQSLIGGMGLISYIDKNECIVTEPDLLYDETKAPNLFYGQNLTSWRERVDAKKGAKGVILEMFDPLEGRMVVTTRHIPS